MSSAAESDFVSKRAANRCEYCQSPAAFATQSFEVEHIEPKSKGGPTRPENLALSCGGCNRKKYTATHALDPLTLTLSPLFHPRKHQWQYHFRWSADFLTIIGITAIGRATVARLELNRKPLQNLRMALIAIDRHPPQ